MKEAKLSWQKQKRRKYKKNPEVSKKRCKEIADILKDIKPKIEAEEIVVYILDECHLQGDELVGYMWGDSKNREVVKISNDRDRQTYYGALNLKNKDFIVLSYSAGNGVNTVNFIEEIKKRHPGKKIWLIWDGASYHRGEEMKQLLSSVNDGKNPEDWLITCCLFAPYRPKENPVEAIWLEVKNFIRRFYYLCHNFSIVKRLFKFFFDFKLFNCPNFQEYDAFIHFI